MVKGQNKMTWLCFQLTLVGEKDMGCNHGFQMRKAKMLTYELRKVGLSAYYDKCCVLPDGVYTEPVEYQGQ